LVAMMCGPDLAHETGDVSVCSPQGAVWLQYLVGASQPADAGF
jgi:hypothetical protein